MPWLFSELNRHAPWMAWPFFVASCFTLGLMLVNVANTWWRSVPEPHPLAHGEEPLVGIIVPCCGEPVPLILRTIASILHQDWPRDRMVIVISDDGHDPALALAAQSWPVTYYSPPARDAPGRDGAAKAGNLNAAFAMLVESHPEIPLHRDTGTATMSSAQTASCARQSVSSSSAIRLAFVQTVKEAQVSPGDPFNNRESMFYRGLMLSRYAGELSVPLRLRRGVAPCGAGGHRPVPDLESRRGHAVGRRGATAWLAGLYLPIVGAVGQHSPEDLPNVVQAARHLGDRHGAPGCVGPSSQA